MNPCVVTSDDICERPCIVFGNSLSNSFHIARVPFSAIFQFVQSIHRKYYENVFKNWIRRLKLCISVGGECLEGTKQFFIEIYQGYIFMLRCIHIWMILVSVITYPIWLCVNEKSVTESHMLRSWPLYKSEISLEMATLYARRGRETSLKCRGFVAMCSICLYGNPKEVYSYCFKSHCRISMWYLFFSLFASLLSGINS